MSAPRAKVKFSAGMDVRGEALRRARELLRGAPRKVQEHRVSVGIHEQEGSTQPIKPASQKPNPNRPKVDYRGTETAATLIMVAATHEFGAGKVPERSWLRSWFDRNVDRLKSEALEAMRAEWRDGDKQAVPRLAGTWWVELQNWIADGEANLAPLAETTRRQRRRAGLAEGPPLYATMQLVSAIRALCDGRYEAAG